jgi:hypothetical protein
MTDLRLDSTQLTVGGLLTITLLGIIFTFIIRVMKMRWFMNGNGNSKTTIDGEYRGPERRKMSAGAQTTEYWETFFSEASLKASERAVTRLVMPILTAMQVGINQTQVAVQSMAESNKSIAETQKAIADILTILKERDDRRTAVEIAEDAAGKVAAATAAGKH